MHPLTRHQQPRLAADGDYRRRARAPPELELNAAVSRRGMPQRHATLTTTTATATRFHAVEHHGRHRVGRLVQRCGKILVDLRNIDPSLDREPTGSNVELGPEWGRKRFTTATPTTTVVQKEGSTHERTRGVVCELCAKPRYERQGDGVCRDTTATDCYKISAVAGRSHRAFADHKRNHIAIGLLDNVGVGQVAHGGHCRRQCPPATVHHDLGLGPNNVVSCGSRCAKRQEVPV
jgi:hypothetical protein